VEEFGMPKIRIEKPKLPTLWVDTAIGMKLAKVSRGESISDVETRRMTRLKELVVGLARSCRLLCPEGDQELEYWDTRLDEGISKEFAALSRGIRLLPHQAVHNSQIFIAMAAHVRGDREFRLPSEIYFRCDPVSELRKISQQSIFVSVHGLPKIMLDMNNENRKGMYSHLETLRLENNTKRRTYAEQFALEQRAFVNSMADFSRSFRTRLLTGDAQPWEHLAAMGYEAYFSEWCRLTRRFADWEGLCNFFVSDCFYDLPATKISSQLYAKLVTDNRPIEHGDSMDVKHLSLAIPMAHFVLTDRKMANRIADLGIDKEWDALVFSESSIEALFAQLEEIGRS
jgi:hypothetical protein